MRENYTLPRFYVETDLAAGGRLSLSYGQTHKLTKVLRKNTGAHIRVFNGRDGEWQAEVTQISKREALANITTCLRQYSQVPDLELLFSPVKKEPTRFIVEKATELGARIITPIFTARTQHKIRMDKLHTHIIEAAEQTERLDIPQTRTPVKLMQALSLRDANRPLIFADEAGDALPALTIMRRIKAPVSILIGPEGGFTDEERTALRKHPAVKPVSLGPRILRAESAAIASLALWQAVSGDWAKTFS